MRPVVKEPCLAFTSKALGVLENLVCDRFPRLSKKIIFPASRGSFAKVKAERRAQPRASPHSPAHRER